MALLAASIFLTVICTARFFFYLDELKHNKAVLLGLQELSVARKMDKALSKEQQTIDEQTERVNRYAELNKVFSGMRLIAYEARTSLVIITIFGVLAIPSLVLPDLSPIDIDFLFYVALVIILFVTDVILMFFGVNKLKTSLHELETLGYRPISERLGTYYRKHS